MSFRSDPRRIRDQVQPKSKALRRKVEAVRGVHIGVVVNIYRRGREEEETISHASVNIRNRGNLVPGSTPVPTQSVETNKSANIDRKRFSGSVGRSSEKVELL